MMPTSVSASSSASGRLDSSGTYNQASGSGDWNVNFGATGGALNGTGGGIPPVLLIVLALGVAWLILKK